MEISSRVHKTTTDKCLLLSMISVYTSRHYNIFTLLQIEQDSEINSHLPVNMSPSQESSPAKKVRTYHVIFNSKSLFQIYKINHILPYILICNNYIVQYCVDNFSIVFCSNPVFISHCLCHFAIFSF